MPICHNVFPEAVSLSSAVVVLVSFKEPLRYCVFTDFALSVSNSWRRNRLIYDCRLSALQQQMCFIVMTLPTCRCGSLNSLQTAG